MLDLLEEKSRAYIAKFGARTVYAADEFFLKAGREVPGESYYEGYPQLENGVGMLRSHSDEFLAALETAAYTAAGSPFTCVTGEAAYGHICALLEAAKAKFPFLEGDVACIRNDFYGESITVAGAACGTGHHRPALCARASPAFDLALLYAARRGRSVFG